MGEKTWKLGQTWDTLRSSNVAMGIPLMGTSINGEFSIATFDYRRVA